MWLSLKNKNMYLSRTFLWNFKKLSLSDQLGLLTCGGMKFSLKLKISFSSSLSITSCRTKIDLLEIKEVKSCKKSIRDGVFKALRFIFLDLGFWILTLLACGPSLVLALIDCCLWAEEDRRFELLWLMILGELKTWERSWLPSRARFFGLSWRYWQLPAL